MFAIRSILTPLPVRLARRPVRARLRSLLTTLGLAALVLLTLAPPAAAQSDEDRNPYLNLRPYPLALWGPEAGFGAGLGLVAHDLARANDEWLLTAAPAQHVQTATFAYATNDPADARQTLLLDARTSHTDRQGYFGTGPRAEEDTRVDLELLRWSAGARLGWNLLQNRLLVQPRAAVVGVDVQGVESSGDPLSALRPRDRAAVPAPRTLGLQAGVDLAYDTRDRQHGALRGVRVQASLLRYTELRSADLAYDQVRLDALKLIPLGGRHRIALRLSGAVTTSRDDAPLPFYFLPKLDGRAVPGLRRERFFGNDLLAGSALYRFPLFTWGDLGTLEGHAGVHAASVYDDVFEQFTPAVSFEESLSDGIAAPLRPAASLGLRIAPLFRDETYVDVAIGVSPEGVSAVRLTFLRPLQAIRPAHHRGEVGW